MSLDNLTPQQRWAKKQKELNRCGRCGRKLGRYQWLCNSCQAKFSSYMRLYRKAQRKAREAKKQALGKK